MRRSKERGFSSWKMAWIAAALVAAGSLLVAASDNPPERIPSYVAWTPETIAAASAGDAFRGMLLAKRCEHCHGPEGFSAVGMTPNLAGMNRLAVWKELQDFRSHKRKSRVMEGIAGSLSSHDVADVVAYYAKVPVFEDLQDNRNFPQPKPDPAGQAWLLIWLRSAMASVVFRRANHAMGR